MLTHLLYPLLIIPLSQFIGSKSLPGAVAFLVAVGLVEVFPKEANFYQILGLDRQTATRHDVARAYRQQAMHLHPDKSGDGERFIHLQRAYETLASPGLRRIYDLHGPLDETLLARSSAEELETTQLMQVGMTAAVRIAVGGAFTAQQETAQGRKWVVAFLLFAATLELLLRFFDEPHLLSLFPIISEYPPFQQASLVNSAFSSVLSIAILVSRELFSDHDVALLRAANATTVSNLSLAKLVLSKSTEDAGSASTKAELQSAAAIFASSRTPVLAAVQPQAALRPKKKTSALRIAGAVLFWLWVGKILWSSASPYYDNYVR